MARSSLHFVRSSSVLSIHLSTMLRSNTLLLLALTSTSAYTTPQKPIHQTPFNRATFLGTTAATCLTFLTASPANAKEVDASVKGTKADPAFQACLSTCLYECTKPKGSEQKSRAECIPECKAKCASTKEQLLLGDPKKN
jgi:hypothetical protein